MPALHAYCKYLSRDLHLRLDRDRFIDFKGDTVAELTTDLFDPRPGSFACYRIVDKTYKGEYEIPYRAVKFIPPKGLRGYRHLWEHLMYQCLPRAYNLELLTYADDIHILRAGDTIGLWMGVIEIGSITFDMASREVTLDTELLGEEGFAVLENTVESVLARLEVSDV